MRLAASLLLLAAAAFCQTPKEIRALAKQGPSAIPQLSSYLKSADIEVRWEAVKGIVDIGGAASIGPLILATRDGDADIQIRATDGLVNFYVPGYFQTGSGAIASIRRASAAIKAQFVDRNDQVIDPYVTVRADVLDALTAVVRNGSSLDSRANAARAAGILRDRPALTALIDALKSKDTVLLYESIVAIQKINDRSAGPRLEFLLHDLNEKVQLAAIETVGMLGDQGALPDLRRVLRDSGKTRLRRAALESIAKLPDPANRALYTQYLADKDDGLREAAAEGFARLHTPADLPMLQKAYDEEPKHGPQLSLAFALVMDGKTEINESSPLRFMISNLNLTAYRASAQPLLIETAQNPAVRRSLYAPMEQGSRDEKTGLAQVLAKTGDKEAESHLEKISRDADPQVAQEGLRALRNLRARL
jgi:HEAT repeat protein